MIAIKDEINLSAIAQSRDSRFIREELSEQFWFWYDNHKHETLISVSFLKVFSRGLTVGQCAPLFVRLFGPQPK